MEEEPTGAGKMPDNELIEAQEAHAADELDGLSIQHQRLARILEYEEAALSRADPFAAVIGMGSAQLQRVFEQMGAVIVDELESRPPTIEELRELRPDIRLLLNLRKSIEMDLAVQPPDAGQQAAAFPHRPNGNGFDTKLASSKRDLLPKRWRANG